ncbi:MAG: hypothetical protein A4E49_00194 [Methanosaeta sp. PtaU1.Bin112]|nr:MAG: hypothetical protein A4E49_00194 [Methanosaeta sp. PtaU1.Bin112]
MEVFLLTKPPRSDRTELCLQLAEGSIDSILYLAGDGVYNLLEVESLQGFVVKRIMACKEDLMARGVEAKELAIVPENFYEHLVKDMLLSDNKIYTF